MERKYVGLQSGVVLPRLCSTFVCINTETNSKLMSHIYNISIINEEG